MAQGFAVLKAAIEDGLRVRVSGDTRWAVWNERKRRLEVPNSDLGTYYLLDDDLVWDASWEIESAPNLLFMEAVAAMDRGEIVERTLVGGLVVRWRRRPGTQAYELQDVDSGVWDEEAFDYTDVHATNWRIVRDVVQEPDNRPTPADVLNFMQAFHAHFPALSYGDWRYVGEELLARWPDIVRRG